MTNTTQPDFLSHRQRAVIGLLHRAHELGHEGLTVHDIGRHLRWPNPWLVVNRMIRELGLIVERPGGLLALRNPPPPLPIPQNVIRFRSRRAPVTRGTTHGDAA